MKFLFLFLLILNLSNLFGQKIIKKISNDICNCTDKVDTSNLDSISATESFENCFRHLLYYTSDLKKKKLDILDSDNTEIITEKVVLELFKSCDSFIKISLVMQGSTPGDTTSSINDPIVCEIFRNGKFLSLSSEDSTITIMNNTEQIVQNLKNDTYSKYEVKWINDCEYTLTYINGTNELIKKVAKQIGSVRVKIIKINDDIITFLTFSNGNSFESKMKKLE